MKIIFLKLLVCSTCFSGIKSIGDITGPIDYYWGCYHFDESEYKEVVPSKQLLSVNLEERFTNGYPCIKFCQTEALGERNYNFAGIGRDQLCICIENLPFTQVELQSCQAKETDGYGVMRGHFIQLFGLCPNGKFGPPVCAGTCPTYCLPAPNAAHAMCNAGDGQCTFGCLDNLCQYYSKQNKVIEFEETNSTVQFKPIDSPLRLGVTIFPELKFEYDGILQSMKSIMNNGGQSYISIWKPTVGDVWEMIHKEEFFTVEVDHSHPVLEKSLSHKKVHIYKGDTVGFHHNFDTFQSVDPSEHKFFTLWSAMYSPTDGSPYLFSESYDEGWESGKSVHVQEPADKITTYLEVHYKPLCGKNCASQCSDPGVCEYGCLLGFFGPLCDKACDAMTFGQDCSQKCAPTCANETCCAMTGRCSHGCISGFTGPFCSKKCLAGTYGPNCKFNCSGNCKIGEDCDKSTGECLSGCKPGYKPPYCKELCPRHTFGDNCSYECGHCKDNDVCRSTNGACPRGCSNSMYKMPQCLCTEGHFMDIKTKTCSETCGHCRYNLCEYNGECPHGCVGDYEPPLCKCPNGFYGHLCKKKCPPCDGGCHYITGLCLRACKAGHFPFPYCNTSCSESYFGPDCHYRCGFCANNTVCSKTSGDCTDAECVYGFAPPHCRCVVGYWGLNCENRCGHCLGSYCMDDGRCPPDKEGKIHCQPGYKPPYCTCPVNTWGEECEHTCGYCKDVSHCSDTNGTCIQGCLANYRPPMCKEILCPPGKYGADCSKECGQCMNDVACDPNSGFCPGKCERGKKPPFCKSKCSPGEHGYSCLEECGKCKGHAPCDPVTGECPQQCEDGYIMPLCAETCHFFTFGDNCTRVCGFCADDEPCDPVSGECLNGCKPNHKPPFCSVCEKGFFGSNCTGNCSTNCLIPGDCNTVSGACNDGCQTNYKPPLCNRQYEEGEQLVIEVEDDTLVPYETKECFPGTYHWSGIMCTHVCGHCKDNAPCSMEGRCKECEEGYVLPMCEECSPGYYGFNCQFKCGKCAEEKICSEKDGTCENGCEDSAHQTTVCKGINELQLEICSYRFFPPDCNTTCPDMKYSLSCTRECGNCKNMEMCGVTDGICYSGCDSGYTGAQCTERVTSQTLVQNERKAMKARKQKLRMFLDSGAGSTHSFYCVVSTFCVLVMLLQNFYSHPCCTVHMC